MRSSGATAGPAKCSSHCLVFGRIYIGNPLNKPGTSGLYFYLYLYLYLYQIIGSEAAEAGHKWGI